MTVWTNTQGVSSETSTSIGSIAFTAQNNAANSLNTLFVCYISTTSTTPTTDLSVIDQLGNVWYKAGPTDSWLGLGTNAWLYSAQFYCINSKGDGTQKLSLTISGYITPVALSGLFLEEFIPPSGLIPALNTFAGSGISTIAYVSGSQTLNCPAVTTTASGCLVYVVAFDEYGNTTTISVGSGLTAGNCGFQNSWSISLGATGDEFETQTSAGSITPTIGWNSNASGGALIFTSAFLAAAPATLDQHSFRFRNDDGSESAATPMASEGTNITASVSHNIRIRVLINNSGGGDAGSQNYQLEYQKNSSGIWVPAPVPAGSDYNINAGTIYQTIDGFGASSADASDALTTALADFFFTLSGINLSILRMQIIPDYADGEAWSTSLGAPSSYCVTVASGPTILSGEPLIAQQALARGVTRFTASCWSPPASMKSNGSWFAGGNFVGNSTNYANYAAILAAFPAFMMTNYSVPIYAISPQNEPDVSQSYPSATWTATQFHDFIPYLAAAIASSGYGPEIMFPEDSTWSSTYNGFADTTMTDGAVSPDVGIMAQHGYGGASIVAPTDYGKPVWVSEDSSQSGTYDGSITDALSWAAKIHSYLTVANVSAYLMWFLTDMPAQGNGTDNAALTDSSGNIALRAYALGNWSRFIRPGWKRIGVSGSGSLSVSAFMSADGTQHAIVVVNSGAAIMQSFSGISASSVTPYVTSAAGGLVEQTAVSVLAGTFSYLIPTSSITTFTF